MADRVIVMDEGKMLMSGKPREVFSKVSTLKAHGLDVPQATDLIERLKEFGFKLPSGVLDEDECTAVLEQLLEAQKCR